MKLKAPLAPPELDHDKMMLARFNQKVDWIGRIRRRVAFNFLEHMKLNGWRVMYVDDRNDEPKEVPDSKAAMELMFNLDEVWVNFCKPCHNQADDEHEVYLHFMNQDPEIIIDWGFYDGDRDGFNAVMEEFEPQDYV